MNGASRYGRGCRIVTGGELLDYVAANPSIRVGGSDTPQTQRGRWVNRSVGAWVRIVETRRSEPSACLSVVGPLPYAGHDSPVALLSLGCDAGESGRA